MVRGNALWTKTPSRLNGLFVVKLLVPIYLAGSARAVPAASAAHQAMDRMLRSVVVVAVMIADLPKSVPVVLVSARRSVLKEVVLLDLVLVVIVPMITREKNPMATMVVLTGVVARQVIKMGLLVTRALVAKLALLRRVLRRGVQRVVGVPLVMTVCAAVKRVLLLGRLVKVLRKGKDRRRPVEVIRLALLPAVLAVVVAKVPRWAVQVHRRRPVVEGLQGNRLLTALMAKVRHL